MPKPILPENLAKLKFQLDKGNNLIDYFVICGIKPSMCTNENLYKFDDPDYINNIELKPEILSKCPTFDKSILEIDSGIINFCFPKGFKMIMSKKEPEIQFNSFILDNALYSFNYPQKFISCLIFYESITKYKKLKDKIDMCSSLNETSADSINNSTNNLENKIPLTSRKSPFFKSRFYFIPKCICVISVYPYINIHQQILHSLYQSVTYSSFQIPIEKIIENLIIEVPVPPRGLYKIEYLLFNKKLELKANEINKIPSVQIKLEKISQWFDIQTIIEIIRQIYYESKILFFSTDLNILCRVLLSFISLIFPYKYPHQIISYLPKENYKTLESISPFIFGINEKYYDNFFDDNEIETYGSNFFIVDIEDKKTKLITDEEMPPFPYDAKYMLEKNVKKYLYSIQGKIVPEEIFNYEFSKIFFDFHLEIIKDYEEYLNEDYFKSNEDIQNANIHTLFKVEKFLNDHSDERKFYEKFLTESNMFSELIYKRMIPKNNLEMAEILLIKDELIDKENRNRYFRKEETIFLSSKAYDETNIYAVQKTRELTSEEIEMFSKDNSAQLLNGQEIILKSKRVNFTYLLFPILNMDLFFNNNNVNEYSPPPDFSEEIDLISTDIISKSYLGSYKMHKIEMKNYIYLTWLELWAFSFWYFDKKERKYRFNQLINVLDKVVHHEMEIFNLLFDVLNKNNEEEMILKLYQKLIIFKLHPSTFIYDIINKLLDSQQIKELVSDELIKNKNELLFHLNENEHLTFRKRTFKNKCEKNVLTSQIQFYKFDLCIECQNLINLYDICTNFSNAKNDVMWISCDNNHYNLPKIGIKFGKELNTQGNFFGIEGKTSTTDEVVLHSPYNIKVNVKNGILREYGTKLDVNNFKMQFTPLFWNCVWYFAINKLDYEFFLPYENHIENYNNFNYENRNSFKICYINNTDLIKAKTQLENNKKRKKYSFKPNSLNVVNEINDINFSNFAKFRNKSIVSLAGNQSLLTDASFINNNMIEGTINYDKITQFSEIAPSVNDDNCAMIKFRNICPINENDEMNLSMNEKSENEFEQEINDIRLDTVNDIINSNTSKDDQNIDKDNNDVNVSEKKSNYQSKNSKNIDEKFKRCNSTDFKNKYEI